MILANGYSGNSGNTIRLGWQGQEDKNYEPHRLHVIQWNRSERRLKNAWVLGRRAGSRPTNMGEMPWSVSWALYLIWAEALVCRRRVWSLARDSRMPSVKSGYLKSWKDPKEEPIGRKFKQIRLKNKSTVLYLKRAQKKCELVKEQLLQHVWAKKQSNWLAKQTPCLLCSAARDNLGCKKC